MDKIKKRNDIRHSETFYLLGINKEREKVWLVSPSWNCGWYWGMGYLQTMVGNRRPSIASDISSHHHFDTLFLKGDKPIIEAFEEVFNKCTLDRKEIQLLTQYMRAAYIVKDYAMLMSCTSISVLKDEKEVNRINHQVLPKLFNEIHNLLKED